MRIHILGNQNSPKPQHAVLQYILCCQHCRFIKVKNLLPSTGFTASSHLFTDNLYVLLSVVIIYTPDATGQRRLAAQPL